MDLDRIKEMLNVNEVLSCKFTGKCADCGVDVEVVVELKEDEIEITGGAVYQPVRHEEEYYGKCDGCFAKDRTLRDYQECEVFSRVVGYLRPVKQWNPGKQAEWGDRKLHDLNSEE